MENKLYFKRLDGLRFFAFFLVFWQHSYAHSLAHITDHAGLNAFFKKLTFVGGEGVHIFFVLSGFLITYLLIKEENSKGKINLSFFYMRRILRIWPLYYLIVISGIFILPNLFSTFKFEGNIPMNLFFLNNFAMKTGSPNVGIAWSVAIEEQFYLFWPLLFMLFRNKKALLAVCSALFLTSAVFSILHREEAYFHTLGNINLLMAGCIGAILFAKNENLIGRYKLFPVVSILAAVIVYFATEFAPVYYLSVTLLPFLYLYVIIYLVKHDGETSGINFSFLGKYTYGMYLYHPTLLIFIRIGFDIMHIPYQETAINNAIVSTIALFVTIGVSILSYNYFETFFLKLKDRFAFVKTRM
ncbi:MAG: acyltransferase [Flavobacteriales bacterium]|nr:acyltransferase [Flavobacteriales bacterium]